MTARRTRASRVARSYESSCVKVISSENRGSSAARNIALAAAQGELIQYLDADDLLSADKIASQVRMLAGSPPATLATCPIVYFNDGESPESGVVDTNLPYAGDCEIPVEFLMRLYGEDGQGGMIQTSQWLTPRTVSTSAGSWDESVSVDNDGEYFARIVLASAGVRYSRQGYVYYRKHPSQGSLSAAWSKSEAKVRSGIKAVDIKASLLLARASRQRVAKVLAKSYLVHGLGWHIPNSPPPRARRWTRRVHSWVAMSVRLSLQGAGYSSDSWGGGRRGGFRLGGISDTRPRSAICEPGP